MPSDAQKVATAGVPVALWPMPLIVEQLEVEAFSDNSTEVRIADSDRVSARAGAKVGTKLAAGNIFVAAGGGRTDLSKWHIDALTAGDGVAYSWRAPALAEGESA